MRLLAIAAALTLAACGSKGSKPDEKAAAGSTTGSGTAGAGPAGSGSTGSAGSPDEVAGWRADLDAIATELPKLHPGAYAHTDEESFKTYVEDLRGKLSIMSDEQRITGLSSIVALVGDAHTQLLLGRLGRVAVYPVSFYWFSDGIVVTDAADAYRWAIGARVVSVGGRPIDDAILVLAATFGWESESWKQAEVPWRLAWPTFMRGTGLAPATGPARFGVIDASGAETELLLEPTAWRPKARPTEPLYRQRPQDFYWSKALPTERALYVQYNKCAEAPDLSFADFTRSVVAGLDGVERLVIDLRLNGGGDSRVMQPLLDVIAATPTLKGRVFVLIGRHTFSSGLMNALALDALGAVLVGEPAGSPASHFGEVKQLELPAHGLALQYSTKRFEYPGYEGPAVTPDVLVAVSSADYLDGKDPVLAAAISHPVPAP